VAILSLQVTLGVLKMSETGWITTTNRALLEVALENVTSGERIFAQNTHVRPITGVYNCVSENSAALLE
jgi:hypothetical protein